jgi:hypothetical protein
MDLLDSSFYARLCPYLTLPGEPAAGPPLPPCQPPVPAFTEGLAARGFARITAADLWGAPALPAVRAYLDRMSAGVGALVAVGLPPLLILVFEEPWEVQAAVRAALRAALPRHATALNDWAVFNVPADGGAAGWAPHRDRPGTAGAAALDATTGLPRYVTMWLPLTPATPETSCLFFLPRDSDPGFFGGDLPGGGCPLAAALAARGAGAAQRLVAAPAAPGALLAFGSRTLHYGSAPLPPLPSAPPREPRRALSFALAEEGFEPPAWRPRAGDGGGDGRGRPLAERVALAAAQALVYAEQAPLPPGLAQPLLDAFLAGAAGGAFEALFAERATRAGRWAAFKDARRAAGGERGGGGAPSERDVRLAFAGLAAAGEGMDAAAYV